MRRPFRDGYDPVGPFHPFLAWAGVILIDLIGAALILSAITVIGDKIEDAIWPGGPEWVEL